jgi:hypothetical protein
MNAAPLTIEGSTLSENTADEVRETWFCDKQQAISPPFFIFIAIAVQYRHEKQMAVGAMAPLGWHNPKCYGLDAHLQDGGAVYLSGDGAGLTVTQSTLTGNVAQGRGGAVAGLSTSMTVSDSTVSDNQAVTGVCGPRQRLLCRASFCELLVCFACTLKGRM